MIKVHLATSLRDLTDGVSEVEVEAATVRRLIKQLDQLFPGMGERLAEGVSVSINGEIIPDAIYEDLPEDAEVHFLPTLSGG